MTKSELKYALNHIQELQRKNLGIAAMCVMTYNRTSDFGVLVNFNFKELPSGSTSSEYKTINFTEETTHDEYIDSMSEIDKLIKQTEKKC